MKVIVFCLFWILKLVSAGNSILVPSNHGHPQVFNELQKPEKYDFEEDKIEFLQFTKANPEEPIRIIIGNSSTLSKFDPTLPTKIISHGWLSNDEKLLDVNNGYLNSSIDVNIISVDWSAYSRTIYTFARLYVVNVGDLVAKFVNFLLSNGSSKSSIHLIGHSLGAHVMGVAGNRLKGDKIFRITGLDPARPLFSDTPVEDRLDMSDATFVDIIHSSAVFLGWNENLGHVDFWPNGGYFQPGCWDPFGICNHSRSHKLFAESISSRDFKSVLCNDYFSFKSENCSQAQSNIMGEFAAQNSGSYYLWTNKEPPFAKG